jgi:c-di-GMP-binding flagellar brake protein YcgR
MELDDILPGCKLDVVEPKLDAEGKDIGIKHSYKSSLYSVLDNNHIEIMTPQEETIIVPLMDEGQYKLIFTTSQGLLRANGQVVKKYKKENFYLTEFMVIGSISKYQRREFFRIDCMVPVEFTVLSNDAGSFTSINEAKREIALKEERGESIFSGKGTIIDISGGGIRFTTSSNIENYSYVLFKFELYMNSGSRALEVIGKPVHSDHILDTNKYSHRIQFQYTDGVSQEVIIRYIFEVERSRRRKEQGL